jgi:DNA-binding transcriptional MocR family regulator
MLSARAGGALKERSLMRFSRRTDWNTEESELARAHRLRIEAGLPIADLAASNPTRCGFAYDATLLAALANERALDYDPQPRGLLRARQAVCGYYADHGVALAPEQIVLTTSTSEAYSFLFRLERDHCWAAGLSAVRLPGGAGRCASEERSAGV